MSGQPHWLALLPCSESFREAADVALAAEIEANCGVDVHNGFGLMPHDEFFEVRFTAGGVGLLTGDLVGPDAIGELVTLAWVTRYVSAGPVAPADEVCAAGVHFWWHQLPVKALRVRYGGPFLPPDAGDRSVLRSPMLSRSK